MKQLNNVSERMRGVSIRKKSNVLFTTNSPVYLQLNGGKVSLTMAEIKEVYSDAKRLLGHSVYVKASVMTSSGGN